MKVSNTSRARFTTVQRTSGSKNDAISRHIADDGRAPAPGRQPANHHVARIDTSSWQYEAITSPHTPNPLRHDATETMAKVTV